MTLPDFPTDASELSRRRLLIGLAGLAACGSRAGSSAPSADATAEPVVGSTAEDGIVFVYRSHYEGVFSKRVVHLPDASILAWFQRGWRKSAGSPDWAAKVCKGGVYGLQSIFDAVAEHGLAPPSSSDELRQLLYTHLYVEGGHDHIRLDDHTLRVLTDDDEVELAYFFFDRAYIKANPDRVDYLLREQWPLPDAAATQATFTSPVKCEPVLPAAGGSGRTYVCLFVSYDGDSIPGRGPQVIEGTRLPELCDYLRSTTPHQQPQDWDRDGNWPKTWPVELRLLRGLVESADKDVSAALARVNAYPLNALGGGSHGKLGLGTHAAARGEFDAFAATRSGMDGDRALSRIDVSDHIAQFSMHASSFFGHAQWFLFDDLWASANPHLAASLLRYSAGWDPGKA